MPAAEAQTLKYYGGSGLLVDCLVSEVNGMDDLTLESLSNSTRTARSSSSASAKALSYLAWKSSQSKGASTPGVLGVVWEV